MDEFVSVSLNKDGTIAFNVSQEQFGRFVKENFELFEKELVCMLKIAELESQCKKDLEPVCKLKDFPENPCPKDLGIPCPKDLGIPCRPKVIPCLLDIPCPKDIPCPHKGCLDYGCWLFACSQKKPPCPPNIFGCMALGILDQGIISDIYTMGFPFDKYLDVKQVEQIKQIRK